MHQITKAKYDYLLHKLEEGQKRVVSSELKSYSKYALLEFIQYYSKKKRVTYKFVIEEILKLVRVK